MFAEREQIGGDSLQGCEKGARGLRAKDVEVLERGFDSVSRIPGVFEVIVTV